MWYSYSYTIFSNNSSGLAGTNTLWENADINWENANDNWETA